MRSKPKRHALRFAPRRSVATGVLLALLVSLGAAGDDDGWEPVDAADGVRVFHKTVPGSQLMAFRGEATVDVPVARLVGVLLDNDRATDWVDLLVESVRLRQPAENESVVYNRYDLTWPVRDRDYVLHRVLTIDADARVVTATYRSVEDPKRPPGDCCVRARTDPTVWHFTPVGRDRTRVEVEVFTDPRGSIPSWLANTVQRSWPHNSILALARRAARDDVTPYPPLGDW